MILLHAYAQTLLHGLPNPKTYPWWGELLPLITDSEIIQIGILGDLPLVSDFRQNLPLKEIYKLIQSCDYWISNDSFIPHAAHQFLKPGVVLWSVSDPILFGYPENLNLLRSRQYVRKTQFRVWEEQSYDEDAFFPPEDAAKAIIAWRAGKGTINIEGLHNQPSG